MSIPYCLNIHPGESLDAVREAILAPVRAAAVDAPVVCSEPRVDAVCLNSPRGLVIPLANYTLHPLTNVHFSVRADRDVARVESIRQGRLHFRRAGGRLAFSLPLESTDYIKLYYDTGFQIRIARRGNDAPFAGSAQPARKSAISRW